MLIKKKKKNLFRKIKKSRSKKIRNKTIKLFKTHLLIIKNSIFAKISY